MIWFWDLMEGRNESVSWVSVMGRVGCDGMVERGLVVGWQDTRGN